MNVEVDSGPRQDLSLVMDELRTQYEGITDKNRKDMESWYKGKVREARQATAAANRPATSQPYTHSPLLFRCQRHDVTMPVFDVTEFKPRPRRPVFVLYPV